MVIASKNIIIQRDKQMKIFSELVLVATSVVLISTAAMAEEVKLRIAGTVPAEHFGNAVLEQMAKDIEDAGVGISVKYFPASQLVSGE